MVIHRGITAVKATQKVIRNKEERLFIGTLGVNCLEYTRRCIETVQTSAKKVRFVYIDNGSTQKSVDEIRSWKKKNASIDEFLIGLNGYNAGVAVGWNQLIKMALDWNATKIIICNNDIAFGPKTIDGLMEAYDRLSKEIPETVMVTSRNVTKNPTQLASINQEWKHEEHPDFSCFMITPDFVDKVGYFSECYKPAFFEDNDMHWRILMTGYKAFGTCWSPYSHIASRTRYGNPEIVPHLRFRENKIEFYRNMMTDTVDQSIPDARYAAWLSQNPGVKHPSLQQVLSFAREKGMVTDKMVSWLNNLTPSNVPN